MAKCSARATNIQFWQSQHFMFFNMTETKTTSCVHVEKERYKISCLGTFKSTFYLLYIFWHQGSGSSQYMAEGQMNIGIGILECHLVFPIFF